MKHLIASRLKPVTPSSILQGIKIHSQRGESRGEYPYTKGTTPTRVWRGQFPSFHILDEKKNLPMLLEPIVVNNNKCACFFVFYLFAKLLLELVDHPGLDGIGEQPPGIDHWSRVS